jgi:AcrR family transcriptional regulator
MAATPSPSRRSDATRAAILVAARERFAAQGYERATIRGIAAAAGVDPALVMRYYGSKEKLFAAAAQFDLRMPDLSAVPRDRIGSALAEHFLGRWEEDDTLMALLRAGVTNKTAAGRLRGVFGAQVAPLIAALSGDPATAATRAGLVSSQVLGFALCRFVLRLPPIVAMSRAEAVGWLGPTLQRYLLGPSHAGQRTIDRPSSLT